MQQFTEQHHVANACECVTVERDLDQHAPLDRPTRHLFQQFLRHVQDAREAAAVELVVGPVIERESSPSIEIKWYKIDDAGKEKEYFNTKLDNVKVVAVKPKMLDIKNPAYEKHNHLEDVELRYEKITWSYKDGNIIHADSWNERS